MLSGQNFIIDRCGDFILNDPKYKEVVNTLSSKDKEVVEIFLKGREKFLHNEQVFFKSEQFSFLSKVKRNEFHRDNHILREQLSDMVEYLTPKILKT